MRIATRVQRDPDGNGNVERIDGAADWDLHPMVGRSFDGIAQAGAFRPDEPCQPAGAGPPGE